ncbi:MAG: hypothetical protein ACFB21_14355 [Opitutales bacterium]
MKRLACISLLLLLSAAAPAKALHTFKGQFAADGTSNEITLFLLQDNQFVCLVVAERAEATLGLRGTWTTQDNVHYDLQLTTQRFVGGEEIPIKEAKLSVVAPNTAVLTAGGLGALLTSDNSE